MRPLHPAHQEQHEQNQNQKTQTAAWVVSPASAVWPRGKRCEGKDDQHDDKNDHKQAPPKSRAPIQMAPTRTCAADRPSVVQAKDHRVLGLLGPFSLVEGFDMSRPETVHRATSLPTAISPASDFGEWLASA